MADNDIELSVKAQLDDILADLNKMKDRAKEVQDELAKNGKGLQEGLNTQSKKTENFLTKLRSVSGRVATQIIGDFKSLAAIEMGRQALSLSDQFRGAIKESVTLHDTVRKLGGIFGIASKDFSSFQSKMTKGLGKIGLDSTVAANAMQGLVDTPVRGQESLLEYARLSGQLASISGEKGAEGVIAKGISDVIIARGGDPNNMKEVGRVAEDLRKLRATTGKSPTESLKSMQGMFTGMAQDMRSMITTSGLSNIAAISQTAGPASEAFFKDIMGRSKIERQAFEQQGFKDVFSEKGFDLDKFEKASKNILSRVGGDPRLAAKTLGLSDSAAEGFVRLTEKIDASREAVSKLSTITGSINQTYKESRTLGEAFKANINNVKSSLSDFMAPVLGGATDLFNKTSETQGGSAAIVAGGGILASILAGGALRGVGKGLGLGGFAKAAAVEAATGEKVQKVHVINASEIGSSFPVGGISTGISKGMGKMMLGMLGKAGLVGAAGAIGYGAGTLINEYGPTIKGKTSEGFEGGLVERLFFKLDKLIGGESAQNIIKSEEIIKKQNINVVVKSDKDLKITPNNRGVGL